MIKKFMKKIRIVYVPTEQANLLIKLVLKLNTKKSILSKCFKLLVRNNLQKKYNIIIGDKCDIGVNVYFPHPQNIVIGEYVKIGNNCILYQDITIGQNKGEYPILGNNIIVYPGAKIFGDIRIGDNSVIGANSVVNKNFENNTVIGGNPGRMIGEVDFENKYY